MKRRLAALCGLLFPAAIAGQTLWAASEPPAPAAPSASAPVAVDAAAGDASASPMPLDAEPIPTERTPVPKPEEWRAARQVLLTRNTTRCRAYRVREWLKVRCTHIEPAGIALLSGPSKDVLFFIDPLPEHSHLGVRGMEVIFRLEPGKSHVFQFSTLGDGYWSSTSASLAVLLADSWMEGEAPVVTLH